MCGYINIDHKPQCHAPQPLRMVEGGVLFSMDIYNCSQIYVLKWELVDFGIIQVRIPQNRLFWVIYSIKYLISLALFNICE